MKTVATSEDEAMFCTVTIKPNFQALRERAAPKLKPIGEALKRWATREIAELERGKTIDVVGVAIRSRRRAAHPRARSRARWWRRKARDGGARPGSYPRVRARRARS